MRLNFDIFQSHARDISMTSFDDDSYPMNDDYEEGFNVDDLGSDEGE